MSKPGLYLCRLPWHQVAAMGENPHIRAIYPKIVASHQIEPEGRVPVDDTHIDYAVPEYPSRSRRFLTRFIIRHGIGHVVASQKLLWYSTLLEEVCYNLGVQLTWSEPFYDGRFIFDKSGLQYTGTNDIRFQKVTQLNETNILPIGKTREIQPVCPSEVEHWMERNCFNGTEFVIFGQVPWDMALRDHPGLGYVDWIRELVSANPTQKFLFKHHPKASTTDLDDLPNLQVVNESISFLFQNFKLFGAFSSSTIMEGMMQGAFRFATGGYHFMYGLIPGFLHPKRDEALLKLKSDAWNVNHAAIEERLKFITNAYALPVTGEAVANRLMLDSETFFKRKLWVKNA